MAEVVTETVVVDGTGITSDLNMARKNSFNKPIIKPHSALGQERNKITIIANRPHEPFF